MPSCARKDCQVHCLTVIKAPGGSDICQPGHGIHRCQALWQLMKTGLTTKLLTVTRSHDEQVSKGDGDDPLYVVECDLAGRTMNIVNPAGETCIYIQKRWASCAVAAGITAARAMPVGPLTGVRWGTSQQGPHTTLKSAVRVHPEHTSHLRGSTQKSLKSLRHRTWKQQHPRVTRTVGPFCDGASSAH